MPLTEDEYRESMLSLLRDISVSLAEIAQHEKSVSENLYRIAKQYL